MEIYPRITGNNRKIVEKLDSLVGKDLIVKDYGQGHIWHVDLLTRENLSGLYVNFVVDSTREEVSFHGLEFLDKLEKVIELGE